MAAGRAVVIAIIMSWPGGSTAGGHSRSAVGLPGDYTAYAASAGGSQHRRPRDGSRAARTGTNNNNGNNNNNNNDNGDNNNGNNNNNNNDNGDNNNGNSNGNGNDNNGNDNDGNDNVRVVVRHPNESVNRPTKCFDTREVGVVQLGTGSYDVTVHGDAALELQPDHPSDPEERSTHLAAVSGGTLVDSVVFELRAQSSCDGADIGTLPEPRQHGHRLQRVPAGR